MKREKMANNCEQKKKKKIKRCFFFCFLFRSKITCKSRTQLVDQPQYVRKEHSASKMAKPSL